MERAMVLVGVAAVLPACSCVEQLLGRDEKSAKPADRIRRLHSPLSPTAPEKLVSLFPKLEGWTASTPQGAYVGADKRKFSRATGTYTRKDGDVTRSATVTITDGSNVADLDGPLVRMAHAGPSNPHVMGINLDGHSGLMEWQQESGRMTAAVIVAQRFSITLEGEQLSPDLAQAFLSGIDVKQLASWGQKK